MAAKKQYAAAESYERKLERIMERFGATDFDYNYDRHGAWVSFSLRGQMYRFEHTLDKAKNSQQPLSFGSDCFAQIVLALEDLARMAERGIYELSTWLAGVKFLPPPAVLPDCFRILGFSAMPESADAVKARYKDLAKQLHSDAGGNAGDFAQMHDAMIAAVAHFEGGGQDG
ncbi:MAG TPA: J domain-containing protein [Clostridia bacterium]|nr:J domain-containing protein [Clostridia bacterium]